MKKAAKARPVKLLSGGYVKWPSSAARRCGRSSKDKNTRYVDIREGDELDEAQWASWLKQATALPGGEGLGQPP